MQKRMLIGCLVAGAVLTFGAAAAAAAARDTDPGRAPVYSHEFAEESERVVADLG
ncbi:hypothetical protein [Allorhizocola rhizosphaerae]|uniref:hypothetical protein n=1 Tax=Allorhizocola rhizosphaerae TaxID=1872709 RepID=UPI0013C2BD4C|nr:hypothetical protein [Allorhizocola rhizosphaerae]